MAGIFANPIFHGFLVFVVITIFILCAYLACTRNMPCCCDDDEDYEDDGFYGDHPQNRQDNSYFMETPKFYPGEDFQAQNTMRMEPDQMVPQQMQNNPAVSPHPSMINHQTGLNHVQKNIENINFFQNYLEIQNNIDILCLQLAQQALLSQQLAQRNMINSIQNSPGQSVQNMANHQNNISQGVYSKQTPPQMQDVIMPQSQNILEKEAELEQEQESMLVKENNNNIHQQDLGAPLDNPIQLNHKPSILKATAVKSQNSLYHGSQRNIRHQHNPRTAMSMNLNTTTPY